MNSVFVLESILTAGGRDMFHSIPIHFQENQLVKLMSLKSRPQPKDFTMYPPVEKKTLSEGTQVARIAMYKASDFKEEKKKGVTSWY